MVFTGGEPLLRPDILDLLRGLRDADPEHHILRCLNTNGHLVTPELARELVGLADEVRVSLDALPERNDALRGEGNFDAAVHALECYYAVGFEPKVLVTITSLSLPDLEELLCFLIKKKITRINLNVFRPIGRGKGHWEWQADAKEVRAAVRRAWERCYPDQPVPPEPSEPEMQFHCGVGFFLNLMPNGDVFPCHVLTDREFRCGNVREQSLLETAAATACSASLNRLIFRNWHVRTSVWRRSLDPIHAWAPFMPRRGSCRCGGITCQCSSLVRGEQKCWVWHTCKPKRECLCAYSSEPTNCRRTH